MLMNYVLVFDGKIDVTLDYLIFESLLLHQIRNLEEKSTETSFIADTISLSLISLEAKTNGIGRRINKVCKKQTGIFSTARIHIYFLIK